MPKKEKTAKARAAESLLVELLTEELPPKSLKRLSEVFTGGVFEGLKERHFLEVPSQPESFATPRRLAVLVSGVLAKQDDRIVERKGPSVQLSLDANGRPTQALLGFARSCGVEVSKLERRKDEKSEYFVCQTKQKGEPLANHLTAIVEAALKKLPVAKLMRWGSGDAQFVRPVHSVILLHGSKVVPGTVLGLKSGNKTRGHRFQSKGTIIIRRASDYASALAKKGGFVVASFAERRDLIRKKLTSAARARKAHVFLPKDWSGNVVTGDDPNTPVNVLFDAQPFLRRNEELLDEVTAIVEWPVVYHDAFDMIFLEVPSECIALTMQKNQKYFALFDEKAQLLPQYLFVSNLEAIRPSNIILGNARVLCARLSDAKFFYDQDRKHKLKERVPRLEKVVYHNKLGSQLDRVQRLVKLASDIARMLGTDVAAAESAAYLCKADLLTDMVGEFPELQGIMGGYYARHDGEARDVADAIGQHYFPLGAGGSLPKRPVPRVLALADKLEMLVGMFGVGLAPTGEKDPFGLRRAALGVIRILLDDEPKVYGTSHPLPLDLSSMFERAHSLFPTGQISVTVGKDLYDFFMDRLCPYLRERGYAPDEIDAVLALNSTRLDRVISRLDAIKKFRTLPEGMALSAANKRIRNILRQADGKVDGVVNPALLREEAEKQLALAVQSAASEITPMIDSGDYNTALKRLAALRPAVDEFFDKVMVMADDPDVRSNRLALLNNLGNLFLQVADVSRLQG